MNFFSHHGIDDRKDPHMEIETKRAAAGYEARGYLSRQSYRSFHYKFSEKPNRY